MMAPLHFPRRFRWAHLLGMTRGLDYSLRSSLGVTMGLDTFVEPSLTEALAKVRELHSNCET